MVGVHALPLAMCLYMSMHVRMCVIRRDLCLGTDCVWILDCLSVCVVCICMWCQATGFWPPFVPVVQNLKSARVPDGIWITPNFSSFRCFSAVCLRLSFLQWGCEYGTSSELDQDLWFLCDL